MVADTSSRGSRIFPEISIHFGTAGRSSQIVVSPVLQITAVSAVIAALVALCYLGVSRIGYDRLVADKEAEVVRTETANADLQDEASSLRDKLAVALRDREQVEARLSASAGQAETLNGLLSTAEAKLRSLEEVRGRLPLQRGEVQQQSPASEESATSKISQISQLTRALEQTQRELHQVEAQRAALAARLSKIEADHTKQPTRHGRYKASRETTAKRLQQLIADRDRAAGERDRLRARIGELEQKNTEREILRPQGSAAVLRLAGLITSEIAPSETDPPDREVVITDAPPEPRRDVGAVAELGRRISEFARVLASTGIDIQRLFSQFGLNRAEGGPFVPPPKGDRPGGISPDTLEGIRGLIESLPLSTPLDYYQLESRFGPRHDPFNRRASFHTGLDLSAPYMSPIYATAPGVVTYAGYRGDYGRVVEIDHGNGIATVYGHMHRFIVSVGQRVAAHAQIGFLGSTGRSSGPHVHYEVLVNAEPQDPEKFIGLSRLMPVSDR